MEATNRMMGGLGYPPDVYTQNGSECANFIIKHVKTKNKLDMVECLEMIHKVVARQQTLEYLAMCGQGEWFLNESYAGQKINQLLPNVRTTEKTTSHHVQVTSPQVMLFLVMIRA